MAFDPYCRCMGTDGRTRCGDDWGWEDGRIMATQEDGLCDGCRATDCEGRARIEMVQTYREMAPKMSEPEYWLDKADELEKMTRR